MKEQEFNTLLSTIETNAETLAQNIHEAGIAALIQANEFGNMSWGINLVKAIGRKHAAKRVTAWLVMFGRFKIKEGELVAAGKKKLVENWLEEAKKLPYWEAYEEQNVVPVTLDYYKLIQAVLNKQEKLENQGREYIETNIEIKEKLQELLISLT